MQVCGVAYLRTQDFDCTKSLSSTMAGSSNTVMAGRSAAQKGGLFEFHRGKKCRKHHHKGRGARQILQWQVTGLGGSTAFLFGAHPPFHLSTLFYPRLSCELGYLDIASALHAMPEFVKIDSSRTLSHRRSSQNIFYVIPDLKPARSNPGFFSCARIIVSTIVSCQHKHPDRCKSSCCQTRVSVNGGEPNRQFFILASSPPLFLHSIFLLFVSIPN